MKCRNYVVTYYSEELTDAWGAEEAKAWYDRGLELDTKFGVLQLERCPETSRLHIQGYVEFNKSHRVSALQRKWPGIHCEKRKGNRNQAIDYCEKEETRVSGPFRFGDDFGQGKRSDLEEAMAMVKRGASELELAESMPKQWCRYRQSFKAYRSLLASPRDFKTKFIILWGVPGSGKTSSIYREHDRSSVFPLTPGNGGAIWWDGYDPVKHKVVLLDDFYGWVKLSDLLRWTDEYQTQVQIKGAMIEFRPEYVYVTSNKHYDEWYEWAKFGHDMKRALERRITEIKHFAIRYLE